MSEIVPVDHISQYNQMMGAETQHPLVGFVDCYKLAPIRFARKRFGFYAIFVKDIKYGELNYGRSYYDYEEGSVVFIAPGQIMGSEDDGQFHQARGYVLMVHPDFLHGTPLAQGMKEYSFFNYESSEALHLSPQERKIMLECFERIRQELLHPLDKYSKLLIVDTIKLFLDYCSRFYDRQFISRENLNKDILVRFENLLNDYFDSDKPKEIGLPTVQYCAEYLHLSPNYFSDLIRQETGTTPLKYIHLKVIDVAKARILTSDQSFGKIAYELGFRYSQHFSRFFKHSTGVTPSEYRLLN